YQPLELSTSVRIVILGRGSADDPIDFNLVHIERDPFISIAGCHVQIRANLHHALRQIRLEEEDRHLWIDALCINQKNTQEESYQVQSMGQLYAEAENVVIWLGMACNQSDLAMDLFNDPSKLEKTRNGSNVTQLTAIFALCERSYWRRVWTQQEVYLARQFTAHCGSKCITDTELDIADPTFVRFMEKVDGSSKRYGEGRMSRIIQRRRIALIGNSLRTWLIMCIKTGLESSHPRDLIYAMLGISRDHQNSEIVPDYDRPLREVYFETILFCEGKVGVSHDGQHFAQRLADKLDLTLDDELRTFISNRQVRIQD
ncbi:hypothetical protein P153DRAFT_282082, partial [Dothidotthia symphoricarpi CBS 119687]